MLETAVSMEYGTTPLKLSTQHSLECVKNMVKDPTKNACDGGRPEWIWQYSKDQGGIVAESSYPLYNKNPNGTCATGKAKEAKATIDYWARFASGSEEEMKCRLALNGPIHASISIDKTSLMSYKSGLWDDPEKNCNVNRSIDHTVIIVGYGSEISQTGVMMDYWIIQNSWGPGWGTNGFAKIRRGVNLCLVASESMYIVLKTAVAKPLTPVYKPTDCVVKKDVYSNSGAYIKSLCIDMYARDYERARVDCLRKGLQLYRLDSPEAVAGVMDAGVQAVAYNGYFSDLYINGNNASGCMNINNKNPSGPVSNFKAESF